MRSKPYKNAEMSEWFKEHDWKSCVRLKRTGGSNPLLCANKKHPIHSGVFCCLVPCWSNRTSICAICNIAILIYVMCEWKTQLFNRRYAQMEFAYREAVYCERGVICKGLTPPVRLPKRPNPRRRFPHRLIYFIKKIPEIILPKHTQKVAEKPFWVIFIFVPCKEKSRLTSFTSSGFSSSLCVL